MQAALLVDPGHVVVEEVSTPRGRPWPGAGPQHVVDELRQRRAGVHGAARLATAAGVPGLSAGSQDRLRLRRVPQTSTRKTSWSRHTIIDQEWGPAGHENPLEESSVLPEKQFPLDRLAVGQSSRTLFEVGGQHRQNL